MQYDAIPYRTVPYRIVPYRTVPYHTIPIQMQCNTIQVGRAEASVFLFVSAERIRNSFAPAS
eukprot:11214810-Lingulodinium_polyedra.AAC.1